MISVKAVKGRIARTSPRGELIPSDAYTWVEVSPYVMRLVNFWGDLEIEPAKPVAKAAAPVAPPAPVTSAPAAS